MPLYESFEPALLAARGGAEWAWRAIYNDVAPFLLRYLRGHGAADPEDVLGDVFIQVVKNIGSFEGGEVQFRAWVVTIARRRLIDLGRQSVRRPSDAVPDEVLQAAGPRGDAEEDSLRALATTRVRGILERLSPDQRDVLFLRILGGFTIEETAEVLGKKAGAVKSLQARGLAAIRREMPKEAVSL
jgi:RNA polymerase sigma-70 factor (ECF subfamily)